MHPRKSCTQKNCKSLPNISFSSKKHLRIPHDLSWYETSVQCLKPAERIFPVVENEKLSNQAATSQGTNLGNVEKIQNYAFTFLELRNFSRLKTFDELFTGIEPRVFSNIYGMEAQFQKRNERLAFSQN